MSFHAWDGKIPHDLYQRFNDAYGAVMHGVAWHGSVDSISGITEDEAIAYAARFLKAMAAWLKAPEPQSHRLPAGIKLSDWGQQLRMALYSREPDRDDLDIGRISEWADVPGSITVDEDVYVACAGVTTQDGCLVFVAPVGRGAGVLVKAGDMVSVV